MTLLDVVIFVVIGILAGWVAGRIMESRFGLFGDLVVGVIGAFLGSWVFGKLNITLPFNHWVDVFITAVVGALILLLILRLIFPHRNRR